MPSASDSSGDGGMLWCARRRNYRLETADRQESTKREETSNHPLKTSEIISSNVSKSQESTSQTKKEAGPVAFDPLSQFAAELDPLSAAAAAPILQKQDQHLDSGKGRSGLKTNQDQGDGSFVPWSARRTGILAKYTTSEKLSITTVLLTAEEKKEVAAMSSANTVSDKVRTRLEQLDDFEEGSTRETLNLTQQEYLERIEEMSKTLTQAWNQDQRVKSLKIVIQCAKLLSDISVMQFYPSKFVLVTDILDTFGKIVYERLLSKTSYAPSKGSSVTYTLPDNFDPEQVPETAKETCRNWFFKIASIRELLPRLYVEAAILKCYNFLSLTESRVALQRLVSMARGVGNPLVSTYVRCYLCRVGRQVVPDFKDHLLPCFEDFIMIYPQTRFVVVQRIVAVQKLDMSKYLGLYCPALDFILSCLAHDASAMVLASVLAKCQTECNSALLLNSVLSTFQHAYISARALDFAHMIQECETTGLSKHLLYRNLGVCVSAVTPPAEQQLQLLNDVWKVVTKLTSPSDYITCAEVWMEYVVKQFGSREVNTMLSDVMKHMIPDRAFEEHYSELENIIEKVVSHQSDFTQLFTLSKFMPFVDLFQKDSVKVSVCKRVVMAYNAKQADGGIRTSDPIVINAMMFLCRTMHDSVTALSIDDEVRTIGSLINTFITSVSYERDLEQQLSFYCECRATFNNIDPVLQFLVHMVNRLSMEAKRIIGKHNCKTAAFVRACAAFSFITIPSLNGVFHKLSLYLGSGQVALMNECVSQAEASFKAVIALIPSIPRYLEFDGKVKNTEPLLADFVSNFMSMLIVVPDPPDQSPLYLIRGLLNIIQDYPWDPASDQKAFAFMNMLLVLSALKQDELPYHVRRIDSNDALYGSDPKFITELNQLTAALLQQIMVHIEALAGPDASKRQVVLLLELFNRFLSHADLGNPDQLKSMVRIWAALMKIKQVDKRAVMVTYEYVVGKAKRPGGRELLQLIHNMAQP